MASSSKWRAYDPTWLVALARAQRPDEPWLASALAACTRARGQSPYLYFVGAQDANAPGADWQFERSVQLNDIERGELLLDVLEGNRIGGVEFLAELLRNS